MGINGIGAVRYLANIKSAAEKYHGGVDWSVDYKVFTFCKMKGEQNNGFWINR